MGLSFEKQPGGERLSVRLNRMLNRGSYFPPAARRSQKMKKADRVVLSVFADLQKEWQRQRMEHVNYLNGSRRERVCWNRLIRHLVGLPAPEDN